MQQGRPALGCAPLRARASAQWDWHSKVPPGAGALEPPHNSLPVFEPFSEGFSQGPWGQLVTLGDRCAILPDVLSLLGPSLSLACAAGKSLDVPAWKCSFLTVSESEFLCLALLIPQLGQSSPVWSCCGFAGLIWSCLKNTLVLHVWFGDRRAWIFLGMCW